MQMHFSPYGGSLECVRCIFRAEGIGAFYRSYTTQLFMNVPFQAVHFMTYEFWQQVAYFNFSATYAFPKNYNFDLKIINPAHKYDPKSHLISGGLAGGLAAAVTNPLDCIKTVSIFSYFLLWPIQKKFLPRYLTRNNLLNL